VAVAAHDGTNRVAQRGAGRAAPEVLVLPDGVRVRTTEASAPRYRLLVPRLVRRVTVRVAGAAVAEVAADALRRGGAVVPLAGR
jgi:hypothetical protein